MARIEHKAGAYVNSDVRGATTDVYEQTRQLLMDAIQNPETSSAEKAEFQKQLTQLRDDFSNLESKVVLRGARTKGNKRAAANAAFRNFSAQVQGIADDLMIAYSHLLGTDSGEKLKPVSADGSGKGSAADTPGELLSNKEALALFRGDIDEFSNYFRSLSPEDRQVATMSLQEEMQAQNQIYSLLSNLHQADHQTGRAIISNVRA